MASKKGRERGQSISFDVLIAVSVFVIAILMLFYYVSQHGKSASLDELVKDGEKISDQLVTSSNQSSSNAIVVKNKLDRESLSALASLSYDDLKTQLGVDGDFCLHFEDEDGYLIDIDSSPNVVQYSIGSPRLNFTVYDGSIESVTYCGEKIPT